MQTASANKSQPLPADAPGTYRDTWSRPVPSNYRLKPQYTVYPSSPAADGCLPPRQDGNCKPLSPDSVGDRDALRPRVLAARPAALLGMLNAALPNGRES